MLVLLLVQGTSVVAQHYVSLGGAIDTTLVLPKLGGDSAYLVSESLKVTSASAILQASSTIAQGAVS